MNTVSYVKEKNQVYILCDYGPHQSIVFLFECFGVNNNFTLSTTWILEQTEGQIDLEYLESCEAIITPITDWISPYWITAIKNVDVPYNGNHLTGGNHGTENGEGEPTATFRDVLVYIDDKLVQSDLDNVLSESSIKLVATSFVEACNTHTSYKRAVLEEKVTYTILQSKIDVKVEFQAKEEIIIMEYSGLQTNGEYYDRFMIPNSELKGYNDVGARYLSGPFEKYGLVDTILLNKKETNDWLKVSLNSFKTMSLASGKELIRVEAAPIKKTYFRLFEDTAYKTKIGECFYLTGTYTFVNDDL